MGASVAERRRSSGCAYSLGTKWLNLELRPFWSQIADQGPGEPLGENPTLEFNARHVGTFLGPQRRPSSLSRSILDCAPASVRDPQTGDLDHPTFHLHTLPPRRSETIADQAGQHVDIKSVREQRCSSAATRFDEHLKRTALVLTECHRSQLLAQKLLRK
jgi:hypothetical protein